LVEAKEISMALFADRSQAGQKLAQDLLQYKDRQDIVILALPRGGVPVAYEVARGLHAPLDVFLVRKLGVPGREELAMGAIASGGTRVLNSEVIRALNIPPQVIDEAAAAEQRELERREREYRDDRPAPQLTGKTVILVDDGLATGASMRAAALAVRRWHPGKVVVAAPTGSAEACQAIEVVADEVVCSTTPEPFHGVGMWYENFSQTSDEEVRDLLEKAAMSSGPLSGR
jgi:putative phosphoribosyl transferase